MKNIIKNALTEWIDNLFVFDFAINLFLILLFTAATICEVTFACYSDSIENIIFNPLVAFMLLPIGYYSYQIGELIVKYNNR